MRLVELEQNDGAIARVLCRVVDDVIGGLYASPYVEHVIRSSIKVGLTHSSSKKKERNKGKDRRIYAK